LGKLYAKGDGVQQDYRTAAKYYKNAAEYGDLNSQLLLGSFFAKGLGVSQDVIQAHAWFNLAAAKGFAIGEISAVRCRDDLAESMTLQQIEMAQLLARDLQRQITKNCNQMNAVSEKA